MNRRDWKSWLASSEALPIDSNPVMKYGTICKTRSTEIRAEPLNSGLKFSMDPCLSPAQYEAEHQGDHAERSPVLESWRSYGFRDSSSL